MSGLVAVGGVVGVDVEHGPVVVAVALEAVAGAHPHPVRLRDAGGQVGNGQAADPGVHAVVGADREGVVEAEAAGGLSQFAAAVDLVAGQPPGRYAQIAGALEHDGGELGLGGEDDLVGHVGEQAAFFVGGPLPAEVQDPVDGGVSVRGGVGEVDGDLAQADPAECPGVLVGGADAVGGGLLVAGLVHDQHRLGIRELTRGPGRDAVPGQVVVDDGAGQKVLQPVRTAMPERLGQGPAVAGVQLHQHRLAHFPGQAARPRSLKTVRDLGGHRPQRRHPCLLGYRGLHGHLVLTSLHKPP